MRPIEIDIAADVVRRECAARKVERPRYCVRRQGAAVEIERSRYCARRQGAIVEVERIGCDCARDVERTRAAALPEDSQVAAVNVVDGQSLSVGEDQVDVAAEA